MNNYPKPKCPHVTNIVHVEFHSKDGLVGYQDNYILPPGMRRIVRSLVPDFSEYRPELGYADAIQQTFQTRTYEDARRICPDCGRHIFKEV